MIASLISGDLISFKLDISMLTKYTDRFRTVYLSETNTRSGREKIRESILRPTWRFLELSPLPQHLLSYFIESVWAGPWVSRLFSFLLCIQLSGDSPNLCIQTSGLTVLLQHLWSISFYPAEPPWVNPSDIRISFSLILPRSQDKVRSHNL